ncbi:polyketide cyclase [Fusarium beomiforme]|uniref:Polyketide cyclase n=1 Tax=Fusarium beomiforme TaxID=44412 RepID=A0A9P5AQ30_9HYPO|nr:polyketide cyclase [Fusarium beomiforme]
MPMHSVESTIVIHRSPTTVFNFISSPANWAGLHPGSKRIIGEGVDKPANGGLHFIETIDDGDAQQFDAQWLVTHVVADKYFEFQFPPDYSTETFFNIVITYTLVDLGTSTKFTRTMTSWIRPEADMAKLDAFKKPSMHDLYLENVRERVESAGAKET